MENRIDITLSEEMKKQILDGISALKLLMPFLTKLSDADRKSMQMLDDGRRPFTEKALDLATRNTAINPGSDFLTACQHDITLYSALASVETELQALLEMVRDTKQLAGAEAYEVARFIYMKAKMAVNMKEPGTKTIVEELGKLFKQTTSVEVNSQASLSTK
jgi:hypothetical protein